jgi:hypothetical protein
MRRALVDTVDRMRPFAAHAAAVAVAAWDQRRVRATALGIAALALLLTAAVVTLQPETATAPALAADGANWRYVVVCGSCGHRERLTEHPARHWEQRDGLLRCPACGEFRASWYRRGAMAAPPGGW